MEYGYTSKTGRVHEPDRPKLLNSDTRFKEDLLSTRERLQSEA